MVGPSSFLGEMRYNSGVNTEKILMGLFTGFTGGSRVTPMEFRTKVRSSLATHGLSHRDIEHVEGVVQLSLDEAGSQRGLDRHEVDQVVDYLHNNRHEHSLSDHQIEAVKTVLHAHL